MNSESTRPPGPWALVTGASSGIGEAICRELATRGWSVVLTARSAGALDALALELREAYGVQTLVVADDLVDPDAPARLEAAIDGAGLVIDLLVNNAGLGRHGPFLDRAIDDAKEVIHLNLTAVTELTHRFASRMAREGRGGRILNVASTAAFQPGPLMAVYYATKAYLVSFSEAMRSEFEPLGITVTTLCPGVTRSRFHERAGMRGDSVLERFPTATSEDVARFGVDAALSGKGVVIPGIMNRIIATLVRFVPRRILPGIVHRIQARRGGPPEPSRPESGGGSSPGAGSPP